MEQDALGLPDAWSGGHFSAARVDGACAKSLEVDVTDVNLISRMLERALDSTPVAQPARAQR